METVEPNRTTPTPAPPILEILRHYGISFRRAGSWLRADCQAHYDSRQNLRWKEGSPTAYCFVCRWKPDAVELVMAIERCDRETALLRCAALLPGA